MQMRSVVSGAAGRVQGQQQVAATGNGSDQIESDWGGKKGTSERTSNAQSLARGRRRYARLLCDPRRIVKAFHLLHVAPSLQLRTVLASKGKAPALRIFVANIRFTFGVRMRPLSGPIVRFLFRSQLEHFF